MLVIDRIAFRGGNYLHSILIMQVHGIVQVCVNWFCCGWQQGSSPSHVGGTDGVDDVTETKMGWS